MGIQNAREGKSTSYLGKNGLIKIPFTFPSGQRQLVFGFIMNFKDKKGEFYKRGYRYSTSGGLEQVSEYKLP